MSLTVRSVKGVLTLTWKVDTEAQTMEASWKIRPSMTEQEKLDTLVKATVFIGRQMGAMPESIQIPGAGTATPSAIATPPNPPETSGPNSSGSSKGTILTPTAMTLAGKPSDGGPAARYDEKFWQDMPTNMVPGHLASSWEMDPDGSAGW